MSTGQVDLAIAIQQGVRARFYDFALVDVPLQFAGCVDVVHPLKGIEFLSCAHGVLQVITFPLTPSVLRPRRREAACAASRAPSQWALIYFKATTLALPCVQSQARVEILMMLDMPRHTVDAMLHALARLLSSQAA